MKTKLLLSQAVLKLNAGWQPMEYISVKEAFLKIFSDSEAVRPLDIHLDENGSISSATHVCSAEEWMALPINGSHDFIGLPRDRKVRVPLVVITPHFTRLPKVTLQLNKRGLYIRDRGCCCYCTAPLTLDQATNDHVTPTSKGGKNTWENCVLSCNSCNSKKGDRTPEEAGMILTRRPKQPNPTPPRPEIRANSPREHLVLLQAAA